MHRVLVLFLLMGGCAMSMEPTPGDTPEPVDRPGPPATDTAPIFVEDLIGPGLAQTEPSDAPVVPGPIEDCVAHCAAREDGTTGGGCAFNTRPESGDCVERCETLRRQSAAAQEAFLWCLENDPLCFQGIGECMVPRMYPEEIPVDVLIVGRGFTGIEGHTIAAAIQTGRDEYQVVGAAVTGGEFEISWSGNLPTWLYHAWIIDYLYVDVNANGRCDPGTDLMDTIRLRQTGDFDNVTLVGVAEPGLRSIPRACDAFNR